MAGSLAIAALVLAVLRPLAAIQLLVASFFFQSYLSPPGVTLTLEKAVGGLALAAWLVDWAVRRRPIVLTPALVPLTLFLCWAIATTQYAANVGVATTTLGRYLSFASVFWIVLQFAQRRSEVDSLIAVAVASASIAGYIGVALFIAGHVYRASGPLSDPNDFAYVLSSTLPLSVWLIGRAGSRRAQILACVATIGIVGGIVGSLSRGAGVGLAAALIWAVVTRRIRLGPAVAIPLVGLTLAAAAITLFPNVVGNALQRKEYNASDNVSSRYYYWNVALDEFRSHPITGVGTGNFEVVFLRYSPPYFLDKGPQTTHNTYLNILAEDGLIGAALFLAFIALLWLGVRTGATTDGRSTAIAAGFVAAVVGAFFLTEQYYAPIWLLGALGVVRTSSAIRQ